MAIHQAWKVFALVTVILILAYRTQNKECVGLLPKEVDERVNAAVKEEVTRVFKLLDRYVESMESGLLAEEKMEKRHPLSIGFSRCKSKEECKNPVNTTCTPHPATAQCLSVFLSLMRKIILESCAPTDNSLAVDVVKWNGTESAEDCKQVFQCAADAVSDSLTEGSRGGVCFTNDVGEVSC